MQRKGSERVYSREIAARFLGILPARSEALRGKDDGLSFPNDFSVGVTIFKIYKMGWIRFRGFRSVPVVFLPAGALGPVILFHTCRGRISGHAPL